WPRADWQLWVIKNVEPDILVCIVAWRLSELEAEIQMESHYSSFRRFQDHPRPIGDVLSGRRSLLRAKSGQPVDCDARVRGGAALSADYNGRSVKAGYLCQGTRGSTLLVRVEDVVLRLHGHMARVSAI